MPAQEGCLFGNTIPTIQGSKVARTGRKDQGGKDKEASVRKQGQGGKTKEARTRKKGRKNKKFIGNIIETESARIDSIQICETQHFNN